MCRWVAYLGAPVFLEEFVSRPCQSLVAQSRQCREAKTEVNADGFGLGWYGERARPGLFRDIRPAWSDDNLLSLAHQIRAGLFFAHVRASTGGATMRANCHPFVVDTHMFMHNGQVPGWERVRRRIESAIADDLYNQRGGTTDSEALFLLLIARGLSNDPQAAICSVIDDVEGWLRQAGIAEPFKFTAAVTDGRRLTAVRYASDHAPPTLYIRRCAEGAGTLVVSEPLDDVRAGWMSIPPQSVVTVSEAGVDVRAMAPARIAVAAE